MKHRWRLYAAGSAAGLANGLFGGGGGMVVIPLLSGLLPPGKLYPTSVALILPVCILSAGVYLFSGEVALSAALPYLAGGLVGGLVGGRLYGRVPLPWLRRLFAAFLFYAGVRYLL